MIRTWTAEKGRLHESPEKIEEVSLLAGAWIDVEAPSREEELLLERVFGFDVPTEADMVEIEPSSRIHVEEGALYMTAQILASRDPEHAEHAGLDLGPVTFILTPERLLTVHHHHPGSFAYFARWALQHDTPCTRGVETFLGLIEAVVDRIADLLEGEARNHADIARRIFADRHARGTSPDLSRIIAEIGQAEERNSMIAESISTLLRVMNFVEGPTSPEARRMLEGLDHAHRELAERDLRSLAEVCTTQDSKVRFLLDATLGVINIQQSDIIKIFSVVAFVFLPPTLIASIYGMNFEVMPELSWRWAYPAAIGAMVVSAVAPWMFFRWKGWL